MILVMGASGSVGASTVEHLLIQGVAPSQIIAGARNTEKLSALANVGVQTRRADYLDPIGMEAAFQGVDTLILIPTKTPAPQRCVEHGNALESARAAGVGRIVFLSLQAAVPTSAFSVAPFILFAECATRQAVRDWVMARMSLYIDPVAEWVPELVTMGRLPYPLKEARIAYVSRNDVSRSLAAIARQRELSHEVVELTGPAALSMPELAADLSAFTESQIVFRSIEDAEYREICRKDGTPDEIVEILASMYRAAEAQEFSNVTADIERLTGVPPETVKQALARLAGAGRPAASLSVSANNNQEIPGERKR